MGNARTRRRMARSAALVLTGALVLGGLAAAAARFGEPLWVLMAPPDRLAALVSPIDPAALTPRAPDGGRDGVANRVPNRVAAVGRAPKPPDAPAADRASTSEAAAVVGTAGDGSTPPVARLGARVAVTAPAPTEIADEGAAAGGEPGAPTFTTEVQNGRTIYRVNGDLLLDPGHLRDGEPVEVGWEYRFLQRGLEKVTLWEVRR
jgi:hypothetical protein